MGRPARPTLEGSPPPPPRSIRRRCARRPTRRPCPRAARPSRASCSRRTRSSSSPIRTRSRSPRSRRSSYSRARVRRRRRRRGTDPAQAALPAKAEAAWRTEIDILRREAEALRERDPSKSALFYGTIAQIATSVLADGNTAAAALHGGVAQSLPGTGLARERWIALFSRRDAARAALGSCARARTRRAAAGRRSARARALLLEIATIEELVSGDLAHARIALEEAREIDPANVAVLEALAEIYLVEGDWDKLVAALSSMADTTSDVVFRSMLRHGAGQIQEVMLHPAAAARASYKIALNDDMTNLPAAASLSSLALAQEDWGELARILVAESDLVDDPRTIRRLTERAADLVLGAARRRGELDRRLSPRGAGDARRSRAPAQAGRGARVERPLARAGRRLRGGAATHQGSGRARRSLSPHRRGLRASLGRSDDAVNAYRNALEAVPTHMPTLQALGALYRTAERWSDLADMDLREAERISRSRAPRRALLRSGRQRRAASRRSAARDLALRTLPRSGARTSRRVRRARCAVSPRRALARHRRRCTRSRHRPSAIPSSSATTSRRSGGCGANACPTPTRRRRRCATRSPSTRRHRAADPASATTLEQAQRWEPVVEILEKLVAQLAEPVDQIAMLHRVARVLETQLGQEERALAAHGRVLDLAPTNETSLRAIGRLHYRAGRWLDVITSYGKQLPLATTPEEQAALYYRIGRVYERKLGRRDDALTAYEVSLDHDPAYRPALRALDRILRRDRLWPRLLDVLDKQARTARTPPARAQIHHARGQIFELHLRDLEKAEKEYAQAVKLSSLFEAAVAALAHVRESRGQYQALEELYSRSVGADPDGGGARERAGAAGAALRAAARAAGARARSPIARRTRRRRWGSRSGSPSCARRGSMVARHRRCKGWRRSARAPPTSGWRSATARSRHCATRCRRTRAARGRRRSCTSRRRGSGSRIPASPTAWCARCNARRRATRPPRSGCPGRWSSARRSAIRRRRARSSCSRRRASSIASDARVTRRSPTSRRATRSAIFCRCLRRRAPHRRCQRAVVGGRRAARARGRGRRRCRESCRRARRRRRDLAVEAQRAARGAASLQAAARAAAVARSRLFARGRPATRSWATSRGCSTCCSRAPPRPKSRLASAELLRRQAELMRDRLGDIRGAVAALQQAIDVLPTDLDSLSRAGAAARAAALVAGRGAGLSADQRAGPR